MTYLYFEFPDDKIFLLVQKEQIQTVMYNASCTVTLHFINGSERVFTFSTSKEGDKFYQQLKGCL